jgi:hypothetical protein
LGHDVVAGWLSFTSDIDLEDVEEQVGHQYAVKVKG